MTEREEILKAAREAGMIGIWQKDWKQYRMFPLSFSPEEVEAALTAFWRAARQNPDKCFETAA